MGKLLLLCILADKLEVSDMLVSCRAHDWAVLAVCMTIIRSMLQVLAAEAVGQVQHPAILHVLCSMPVLVQLREISNCTACCKTDCTAFGMHPEGRQSWYPDVTELSCAPCCLGVISTGAVGALNPVLAWVLLHD